MEELERKGYARLKVGTSDTYAPQESVDTNQALAARYPLNILTPKNHAFLNSGYANIARQLGHAGEQCVMLHPSDARRRSIAEGERVEVFNDRGRFQAEAQVTDELRPGVVAPPLGYWASSSLNGRSANAVNASRYADMGRGQPSPTRCWRCGASRRSTRLPRLVPHRAAPCRTRFLAPPGSEPDAAHRRPRRAANRGPRGRREPRAPAAPRAAAAPRGFSGG